jgi:hypothetical protein
VEAGDRGLLRWYPGRLVRPTASTVPYSSSHVQHSRELSVQMRSFLLSKQEDEENFDLSLISFLETDVISCLSDDRVPDYLLTL